MSDHRVGFWTAYAYDLPNPQALGQWMDVIRPLSWTNHHHGTGSSAYFPELATVFEGHPLGGPMDEPTSPWIEDGTAGDSRFLELDEYWQTFDITTDGALPNHETTVTLREAFTKIYRAP